MLDAVMLLCALAVVETVQGTYQITGDAADALKADTLAYYRNTIDFGYVKFLAHYVFFLSYAKSDG